MRAERAGLLRCEFGRETTVVVRAVAKRLIGGRSATAKENRLACVVRQNFSVLVYKAYIALNFNGTIIKNGDCHWRVIAHGCSSRVFGISLYSLTDEALFRAEEGEFLPLQVRNRLSF